MSTRRKRSRDRVRRHQVVAARSASLSRIELHQASAVERLTYSRKQAAVALGVSISTIDRRVVPTIDTVKTPWGQRLIPVDALERSSISTSNLDTRSRFTVRLGARRRCRSLLSIASSSNTRMVEH